MIFWQLSYLLNYKVIFFKCSQFSIEIGLFKPKQEHLSIYLFVAEFIEKIFSPIDYNTKHRTMLLGINQSHFQKPKIKRNQQKLKRAQNQAILHRSQTNSSIGLKTDRKCISKVNFNFDSINNSLNNNKDVQRIHGKQGTKRVGGKTIFQKGQQKQPIKHKKQHSYLNLRISELTNAQSKDEFEGSSQNILINIKSYRSNRQSEGEKQISCDNFKNHQRCSSTLVEMISLNESKSTFNDSLQQKIKEKYHQYVINRKDKQINTDRKGIKKRHLHMNTSSIQKNPKMNQKSSIDPQESQLLLQGSQKSKHKRPSSSRRSKQQKTNQLFSPNNSVLLQKQSIQKKSLAKQEDKASLNYREMKKFKDDSLKILTSPYKRQKQLRHTSKQNFSPPIYFVNTLITYDNPPPTLIKLKNHLKKHPKKANKKDYAKQNQNLHQILSQCDKYKNDKNAIDPQVTALKYCCDKVISHIQKSNYGLNDTHQF